MNICALEVIGVIVLMVFFYIVKKKIKKTKCLHFKIKRTIFPTAKDKSLRKLFVCAQCTRRCQEHSSTLKTSFFHKVAKQIAWFSGVYSFLTFDVSTNRISLNYLKPLVDYHQLKVAGTIHMTSCRSPECSMDVLAFMVLFVHCKQI